MKKRILVIDNEPTFAELLPRAMPQYEFRIESDPKLVFDAAHEFRPDLFLLDLVMPEINGVDLAALIACDPLLQRTPVVFISALVHTREPTEEPASIGNYPAFGKPFSIEALKKCIDQQLSR